MYMLLGDVREFAMSAALRAGRETLSAAAAAGKTSRERSGAKGEVKKRAEIKTAYNVTHSLSAHAKGYRVARTHLGLPFTFPVSRVCYHRAFVIFHSKESPGCPFEMIFHSAQQFASHRKEIFSLSATNGKRCHLFHYCGPKSTPRATESFRSSAWPI